MKKITPWLWYDQKAQEAAEFYTGVFPGSKITGTTHYSDAGPLPEGTVMTVSFELYGQEFVALNGGPEFQFTEAVSFQILCDSQEEVDAYWDKLVEGGGEHGPCGWLKDRYGLSWQVVPSALFRLIEQPDKEAAQRATKAMMQMGKLDIAELERAAAGA